MASLLRDSVSPEHWTYRWAATRTSHLCGSCGIQTLVLPLAACMTSASPTESSPHPSFLFCESEFCYVAQAGFGISCLWLPERYDYKCKPSYSVPNFSCSLPLDFRMIVLKATADSFTWCHLRKSQFSASLFHNPGYQTCHYCPFQWFSPLRSQSPQDLASLTGPNGLPV